MSDNCALCGRRDAGTLETGGELTKVGELWVHELCAAFSSGMDMEIESLPDDYQVGSLVSNLNFASLASEVRRGNKLRCALCQERGASIGCYCCSRRCYHYPCAQRAGLVEWSWWNSGHRNRVVHCVEHLDPRCEIWWDGDAQPNGQEPSGWYRANVVDGPDGGKYSIFYTKTPYGQESIAPLHCHLRVLKPAIGAGRWKAFAGLCQDTVSIQKKRGQAKKVRCLKKGSRRPLYKVRCLIAGRPLDAITSKTSCDAPRTPSARPLATLASDREQSANAARSCLAQREKNIFWLYPRLFLTPRTSSYLEFDFIWHFLDPRHVRHLSQVCVALYVAVNGPEGIRYFARDLSARFSSIQLDLFLNYTFPHHRNPTLAAWRWLNAPNTLRWLEHSRAGPGGTSLRVGADFSIYKLGPRSGDVTAGIIYRAPDNELWHNSRLCFSVQFENRLESDFLTLSSSHEPFYDALAVGLSLPLAAPSPFWLGTEPKGCGFGLALDNFLQFSAPGLAPSPLQFSPLSSNDDDSFSLRTLRSGDHVGILLDRLSNPTEPILAFYLNGAFIGIAPTTTLAVKKILHDSDLRPAVALRGPDVRASISPAFPLFCADELDLPSPPFGLPRTIQQIGIR